MCWNHWPSWHLARLGKAQKAQIHSTEYKYWCEFPLSLWSYPASSQLNISSTGHCSASPRPAQASSQTTNSWHDPKPSQRSMKTKEHNWYASNPAWTLVILLFSLLTMHSQIFKVQVSLSVSHHQVISDLTLMNVTQFIENSILVS